MKELFKEERLWLLGILLLSVVCSALFFIFSSSFAWVEVQLYDSHYLLNPIEVLIASLLISSTCVGFIRLLFFRQNKRLVLGFTLLALGGLFYYLLLLSI